MCHHGSSCLFYLASEGGVSHLFPGGGSADCAPSHSFLEHVNYVSVLLLSMNKPS